MPTTNYLVFTNVKKSNCHLLASFLNIAVAVKVSMQKLDLNDFHGMVSLKRSLPKHLSVKNSRQYSLIFCFGLIISLIIIVIFFNAVVNESQCRGMSLVINVNTDEISIEFNGTYVIARRE